jgi:hypothetical protein
VEVFVDNFNDRSAAYDALAKRFLARKSILARILKFVVPEFADSSIDDIEKKFIEGDPICSINSVPLNDTLDIKGKSTESKSPNEGLVTFDIIFDAIAPISGNHIKLIINIEPQKTTQHLHYKLMKRAVYYVSRLISSQKEKEFHNDDYNDLKKVYSIWICMDVQNYRADSIQYYHLTEDIIHGSFSDNIENYDLISIIILNLGKNNTSHELLNLLHLLFMDLKSASEKESILRDTYHLELTNNMRKEMTKMGGLMEPLLKIGIQQGIEKGLEKATNEAAEKAATETAAKTKKITRIESIRNLMDTMQWSAQQAMNALKIPPDEQSVYLPLI